MSISRTAVLGTAMASLALAMASTPAFAQSSFKVGDKEVQAHGSIQQGFVFSTGNNFLTMNTRDGSGAMTDGAFNLSTQATSKLRLGAQIYSRNIGDLGNGALQVDWAFADYKVNSKFGVRAGKVKTALGLYNDTQDMEFLHTWALLPQGVYPLDLRSVTIAHVGADAYGKFSLNKAGSLQYTVYAGVIQDDTKGGYRYGLEDQGMHFQGNIASRGMGFDTRWTAPIDGLTVGYSLLQAKKDLDITIPTLPMPLHVDVPMARVQALFGEMQRDRVKFAAEWRQEATETRLTPAIAPDTTMTSRGWFTSGSYRLNDHLELGAYHSRYVQDVTLASADDTNHIRDNAIAGRVDLNQYWHVKVEGHFIDGNGNISYARGFYLRSNPNGFQSETRMLVIRTGVTF
ncbi:MAG: hypothetical protein ABIT71_22745 [Vicinamibacteraceae bacterium]